MDADTFLSILRVLINAGYLVSAYFFWKGASGIWRLNQMNKKKAVLPPPANKEVLSPLQIAEREADLALYEADPALAVELGFEPPAKVKVPPPPQGSPFFGLLGGMAARRESVQAAKDRAHQEEIRRIHEMQAMQGMTQQHLNSLSQALNDLARHGRSVTYTGFSQLDRSLGSLGQQQGPAKKCTCPFAVMKSHCDCDGFFIRAGFKEPFS